MKVFAYYEPVPQLPDHAALVSRWASRWSRLGWDPVVLTYDHDALRHPSHDRLTALVASFDGVTPVRYRVATYRRWLALACSLPPAEVALVCDYDVFNVDLGPGEAAGLFDPACIHNLHYGQCCQPLILNGTQAQWMPWMAVCQLLRAHRETGGAIEPHDDHVVHALRDVQGPFRWTDLCYAWDGEPPKGRMIHLAQSEVMRRGTTKLLAWDELEGRHPCG